MNAKSQQAEQVELTRVESVAGRKRTTRSTGGRTAMAVVTIAIGTALTALVIGVTGGADSTTPPSPGFSPPYGDEVPPQGLDQRLYELGEKWAKEGSRVSPRGMDHPTRGFAPPYGNELPPKGLDQRLYNLADEFAARQRALQD